VSEKVGSLPHLIYQGDGRCYICARRAAVYRWSDYDESSEAICYACGEQSLEKLKKTSPSASAEGGAK
jgi:hypothetical protein